MLQNILNLEGAQALSKNDQKAISGGKASSSCNPSPTPCPFAEDCADGHFYDWACCECVPCTSGC